MQAVLEKIEPVSTDVKTFWFRPEQKVLYTPGQFTEISLPHEHEDERGHSRWFTLSSSPTDGLLSITTKFAHPGSSFKKTLKALRPGTNLHLAEPMGDFVLPKDVSIPLVFVAGGMGVTPFHSIVKWLADTKEKRDIEVILAARHLEDVLFEKLFHGYGAKVTIVLSEPDNDWQGEKGHLTAEIIERLIGSLKDKRLYVSGPEPMVESLDKQLKARGVKPRNLVLDFFPGYQPI